MSINVTPDAFQAETSNELKVKQTRIVVDIDTTKPILFQILGASNNQMSNGNNSESNTLERTDIQEICLIPNVPSFKNEAIVNPGPEHLITTFTPATENEFKEMPETELANPAPSQVISTPVKVTDETDSQNNINSSEICNSSASSSPAANDQTAPDEVTKSKACGGLCVGCKAETCQKCAKCMYNRLFKRKNVGKAELACIKRKCVNNQL